VSVQIHDEETVQLVQALAEKRGVGVTEAVKLAVENELRREAAHTAVKERIASIRKSVLTHKPTGEKADKAFFDSLSGEN
jgi:antitoxin VapB